ncbi:MAG: hypothetical protein CL917_04110 [Deltaproteobacteria bacterium]|nr:hypothetical protein [Deltaproteobacteria bacterium]
MIISTLLLLIGGLFYFLLPPFFKPRSYFFVVGTGINESFQTPFIPFVKEDHASFDEIHGIVVRQRADDWKSRESAASMVGNFVSQGVTDKDTLVLYLTAHGVSDANGNAFLLCDDFELQQEVKTRILIRDLLTEFSRCDAAVKVLILNAGTIDYDPRIGVFVNDFPGLLKREVERTEDPSLWVLCSHQSCQYSHAAHAVKRSVFGLFVTEGLKGAADFDRNGSVDVGELAAFSSSYVSSWVQQMSDGQAYQEPLLFSGSPGLARNEFPVLVNLDSAVAPYDFSIEKLLLPSAGSGESREVGTASQGLTNYQPFSGVLRRREARADSLGPADTDDSVVAESTRAANGDADATQSSAIAADNNTSSGAAKKSGDAVGGQAKSVPQRRRAQNLLAAAWRDRDLLMQSRDKVNSADSPVANWPHLWKEYQVELADIGNRLRGGVGVDPSTISRLLSAGAAASSKPGEASKNQLPDFWKPVVVRELASIKKKLPTLGLARLIFAENDEALGIDTAGLQLALKQKDSKELIVWLSSGVPSWAEHYREFVFLKKLVANTELDWALVQKGATTCLCGESVAALDCLAPGWARARLFQADEWRFTAESLLFNRIGPDWRGRVARGLEEATGAYHDAEMEFFEVRQAQRLCDQLILETPFWIQMQRRTGGIQSNLGMHETSILVSVLRQLNQVLEILETPDKPQISTLRKAKAELLRALAKLERGLSTQVLDQLVQTREQRSGLASKFEYYLQTPLLSFSARESLLAKVGVIARRAAGTFESPSGELVRDWNCTQETAVKRGLRSRGLTRSAELELEFAKLFCVTANDPVKSECNKMLVEIEHYCDLLEKQTDLWSESLDAKIQGNDLLTHRRTALKASREIGGVVSRLYQLSLEALQSDASQQSPDFRFLIRSLRLLDPRDAWRFVDLDVDEISFAANLASTMQLQDKREDIASIYLATDKSFVQAAGTNMARAISAHPLLEPQRNLVSTVSLDLPNPNVVDLQDQESQLLPVSLTNHGQESRRVRLAFDYDPELVEVIGDDKLMSGLILGTPIFSLNKVGGLSTDPGRASICITVPPNESQNFRFRIKRKTDAVQSNTITLDIYDASNKLERGITTPQLLVRRTLRILLPVATFFVRQSQADGAYTDFYVTNNNDLRLKAFPNRLNDFRFGLSGFSGNPKDVSLALYDPPSSFATARKSDYSTLLEGRNPLAEYEYNLLGNREICFPQPPKPEENTDSVVDDSASNTNNKTAAESAQTRSPLSHANLKNGLLAAMTDNTTGQVTYRKIDFRILRPERYVSPSVEYDAGGNRIGIRVSASDIADVPVGGPILLRTRVHGALTERVSGKLTCALTSPTYSGSMFVTLPTPPPSTVRLSLDVDGFPRAFIYDVPSARSVREVPQSTNLTEVKIQTQLEPASSVVGARAFIPASVRVNAPRGSFESKGDNLSVTVSTLTGHGSLTKRGKLTASRDFDTDREVTLGFVKALPDGTVRVLSNVTDFEIDLPSKGLENVNLLLACKLNLQDGRSAESSTRIAIDTEPPLIGLARIQGPLNFATAQSKVGIKALVWDAKSEIQKVEAAFDAVGSGEFPSKGPVTLAQRGTQSEWDLLVPTGAELGERTLLVRAVDQVGNTSDPYPLRLEVLASGAAESRIQQQTVEIVGTVRFRDELISNAELSLNPVFGKAGGNPIQPVAGAKSDSKGFYSIANVPPGSYQLKIRGVIRNRVRLSNLSIQVKPGGERTIQVDVALP